MIWQSLFSWAPKSLKMVTTAMKLLLGRKAMTNLDSILKSRDITLPTKVRLVKAMSSHVWMWELDHKESWAPKNWCFWSVVLLKTLESPIDCKIKPVHPKGNQYWIFTERTDAEAEPPIYFGHVMWRTDSLEKTLMLRKTEGRRRGRQRWDCWMASLTQWTWVWASSGSWWWTEKHVVLQATGLQRVRHNWATELNWCKYLGFLHHLLSS